MYNLDINKKSEPFSYWENLVRIFLVWCTANTNELQKTFVFAAPLI